MAKHIVTCRACKEKFDTSLGEEGKDWIMPSRNWYYHVKCYDNWQSRKDNVTATAADDMWKDAAYQYMQRELLIPVNYDKFRSQWDNLLKKKRTPKGIYFSIRYFYEIENGDKRKAQGGIGIVDYIYQRAVEYWSARERQGERIVEKIEQQVKEQQQQQTIVVHKKKKVPNKRIISLDSVE